MRIILLAALLAGCATRPAEVRVAFDANGETNATARGLADRVTHRRVTADDPVRVASISKLVVALGVMRLVEAGQLDLDRDVSDYLGWQLRNPAFPTTPITLRLLLSHRSSITDNADYQIALGQRLQDFVSDPKVWDAAHAPGKYFRYTNLNFPVVATVIERASGERFDVAMARLVFTPLHLDACYNWIGCSPARRAAGVILYRADGSVARDDPRGADARCTIVTKDDCDLTHYRVGENGGLFSPQGGLRISMRDLAAIGRMFLKNGDGFLTPQSIATLETPAWTYDGHNGDSASGFYCQYGLANQTVPTKVPGCADDLFGDGRRHVGHAGDAYALRSGLWLDRAQGTGVAFFASAVPDGAKGKRSAFTPAEERLAHGR